MKNKVYCKNCEFETFRRMSSYCSRDEKTNVYTGYIVRVEKAFNINGKGRCPHYKKKWWKFWIK